MPFTYTAGERIARGLGVLAPACPRWWTAEGHRPIDPDAIDLADPEHAGILAAIYGSHEKGLRVLHVPPDLAPEFGFAALDARDAAELNPGWRLTIITSRGEHHSRPPH